MKRVAVVTAVLIASLGGLRAQEKLRFEVGVEKGKAGILSGPELSDISNEVARIGFAPTQNVQLTLTYTKWDGLLARDDALATRFARLFNKTREDDSQVRFRDSVLDRRDVEMQQLELGLVKSIPITPKHWEAFMGVSLGMQRATADVSWLKCQPNTPNDPLDDDDNLCLAPLNDADVTPAVQEEKDEFMTSVRGGIRYAFHPSIAAQINLKWIPIGKILEQNYNGVELNLGILFRFGKFASSPS